jgi:hypothetical protein
MIFQASCYLEPWLKKNYKILLMRIEEIWERKIKNKNKTLKANQSLDCKRNILNK